MGKGGEHFIVLSAWRPCNNQGPYKVILATEELQGNMTGFMLKNNIYSGFKSINRNL